MIDICPVGAITSKPFRYSARTWELSRRRSRQPARLGRPNLIVQVKANQVMRVVPLEDEDVNECWIADRDRFSYEALNSDARPDHADDQAGRHWQAGRLDHRARYVADGLKRVKGEFGAAASARSASAAARSRNCTCWPSSCAASAAKRRPPHAPRRLHRGAAARGWALRSRRCRS
jgi:NADH-quinone oxidoreductase subunit G